MPLEYGFRERKTDKNISFGDLRKRLSEDPDLPESRKENLFVDGKIDFFDTLVWSGIIAEKDGVLKYIENLGTDDQDIQVVLMRYLYEEFEFWCVRY